MKVLVACEYTGIVRDCFLAMGHDAYSCDLDPTEAPGPHFQQDVLDILNDGWDLMIAHPPCTYLCASGARWFKDNPERELLREDALEFVTNLWNAPIEKVCIENPVGCINTRLSFMPKAQYVQPYEFGEDASKKTGLWLKNLSPLKKDPSNFVPGKDTNYKGKTVQRWSNQVPCGAQNDAPSKTRGKDRSRTYFGIAEAMATQWG